MQIRVFFCELNLYQRNILLPNFNEKYINLSDHKLRDGPKECLHLMPN